LEDILIAIKKSVFAVAQIGQISGIGACVYDVNIFRNIIYKNLIAGQNSSPIQ
jgi:hypothetical protein